MCNLNQSLSTVDLKLAKRKLSVKALHKNYKIPKYTEKGLSNYDASLNYRAPLNTISKRSKNKEKYLKALEGNYSM